MAILELHYEKKKKIWLRPMTKTPIPTENSVTLWIKMKFLKRKDHYLQYLKIFDHLINNFTWSQNLECYSWSWNFLLNNFVPVLNNLLYAHMRGSLSGALWTSVSQRKPSIRTTVNLPRCLAVCCLLHAWDIQHSLWHLCFRTKTIRWNYVVSNLAQVLGCLFYTYYIFERFCVPVFHNFSREHVTPKQLLLSVFGSMLPGTLVLFLGKVSFILYVYLF